MPRRKEYKSIKVPEETYEKVKDMGKGIGEAVDLLVTARQEAIEKKITELSEVGDELADILLEAGIFEINFQGAGIESIEEHGDSLHIRALIKISVPEEKVRSMILEKLASQETDEEEEAEEDV